MPAITESVIVDTVCWDTLEPWTSVECVELPPRASGTECVPLARLQCLAAASHFLAQVCDRAHAITPGFEEQAQN
ncbi:hypothetical protein GCM10018966_073220 [Streptomyces yanii]